ncbi:MAG: helix-turn-helix transcriptional regulator [Clostridia bacterium]|nr:helix-turn-helix transcriptional regulator [Clostridia bacterium]
MDQHIIGNFIGTKRREKNLTQEQLAERLGVSNKTISKWENGKCMPDYSVIELLCKELEITLAELLDGEEKEPNSIRVYDEEQVKALLGKIQKMEKNYKYAFGIMMILIGFLSLILVSLFGGSHFRDFVSGCLCGLGLSLVVGGIVAIVMSFKKGR